VGVALERRPSQTALAAAAALWRWTDALRPLDLCRLASAAVSR
jgi:hypothetical protein